MSTEPELAPFDPGRAAERLKLLAEPVRLAALLALERSETNVGDLAAALGQRREG